jgi:hypothetical protein
MALGGRSAFHVEPGDGECKFWLTPVRLARNQHVSPHVLRRIEREVAAREAWLLEQWHVFFDR